MSHQKQSSRELCLGDVYILKKIISKSDGFTSHNLSLCNKLCLESYKEYYKNAVLVLQKYFKFNGILLTKNINSRKLLDKIRNNNYDLRKIPRRLFNNQPHFQITYVINGNNDLKLNYLDLIRSISIKSKSLIKEVKLIIGGVSCIREWKNVSSLIFFPMLSCTLSRYSNFFLRICAGEDDAKLIITSISIHFEKDFYKHKVFNEYGYISYGVFVRVM